MTTDVPGLEPTRGLWPVSKKPEDAEKDEFVRLVWRELTPDAFTTINSFEEWFKKTLVPRTIESLGSPQVGRMLLRVTFNHGGMQHFMRWVMLKFTTTKNPVAAAKKPAPGALGKRSAKEIEAMHEYGKSEVVISSQANSGSIPYVSKVTHELLKPREGTTMTIQDLSGFLTTSAFDVVVEHLSGMPFSEKGWRQYLVDRFCSKKMTLSEEIYEGEFQHNLREIKGRYGNWVLNNFTRPVGPSAKKSKSMAPVAPTAE